jgi:hypothetical protein
VKQQVDGEWLRGMEFGSRLFLRKTRAVHLLGSA